VIPAREIIKARDPVMVYPEVFSMALEGLVMAV